VLAYFWVNSAKKSQWTGILIIRATCFVQASGSPRVNPRKREGAGAKPSKKSAWFLFEVNPCGVCSADGSTHTESNKLYRKVKHRYRPNLFPRQRPTAKARPDQAALAASAEARGATHRARPRSPSRFQHWQHSLNTFHTHTATSMKRDRRKILSQALKIRVGTPTHQPIKKPSVTLAFTRYCLTSKLVWARAIYPFIAPPLAMPTLLQYHSTTIAQCTPPCECHTAVNIDNGNIV